MKLKMAAAIAATLLSSQCFAGLMDDSKDLEGKTVVLVGDVRQRTCPIGGRYDCMKWPTNFYEFAGRDICFKTDSYQCNLICKAIVAVGTGGVPSLYVFESIGSDLKKASFEGYKCPDLY